MTTSKYTGSITLYSSNPKFLGPKKVDGHFAVTPGSGRFRLVAAAKFKGGELNKVKCGVILDGSLAPAPT